MTDFVLRILMVILLLVLSSGEINGQTLLTLHNCNSRDSGRIELAIKYINKLKPDSSSFDLSISPKRAWKVGRKQFTRIYSRRPKKNCSYFEYKDYYVFIPRYNKKHDDQIIYGGWRIIMNRKNSEIVLLQRFK